MKALGVEQTLIKLNGYVGHYFKYDIFENNSECNITSIRLVDDESNNVPDWLFFESLTIFGIPDIEGHYQILVLIFGNNLGYYSKLCFSLALKLHIMYTSNSLQYLLDDYQLNLKQVTKNNLIGDLYTCYQSAKVYVLSIFLSYNTTLSQNLLLSNGKKLSVLLNLKKELIQIVPHHSPIVLFKQLHSLHMHAVNNHKSSHTNIYVFSWPISCKHPSTYLHKLYRRSTLDDIGKISSTNDSAWHISSGYLLRKRREVVEIFFGSIQAYVGTPVEVFTITTLPMTNSSIYSSVLQTSASSYLSKSSVLQTPTSNLSSEFQSILKSKQVIYTNTLSSIQQISDTLSSNSYTSETLSWLQTNTSKSSWLPTTTNYFTKTPTWIKPYSAKSFLIPKSSYAISVKTHIQYSSYTSPIKFSYGEMFSTMSNTMLYNLYSAKSFLILKSSYVISVKTHIQYSSYTSPIKSSYGEMFSTMSHTMLYDLYSAKSFLIPKSSYAISVKTHIQYSSYTSPIKSSYGEMFSTMSHTTLYNLYSTKSFLIPKSSYAISLKTHIQYSSYTSPIKSSYGEMFSTMSNTMLYNLYSTKSFLIPKSSYAISVKTHNQYSLYTSSMKSSYGKMFSTMSHTTLYNLYSTKSFLIPKSSYAISVKTHIQYSSYTSPIKFSYGEMFSTMSNTMLYNLYSAKSFLILKSSYVISVKTHIQYSSYTSPIKSSYGEMFSTMSHTMLYDLYSAKSFLIPKSSYAISVKTHIQYSSYTSPIKSSYGEMFSTMSHTTLYNLYSTKSFLIPKSSYAISLKTHIQYSSYTSPIKSSYGEMFSTMSNTMLYNLYSTKSFLIPKSSYAISVKTHNQYSLYTSSMKSSYGKMFSTMSHTTLYNLYSTKSFLIPKSSYAISVKTHIQYSSYTSPIKSSYGEMFSTMSHTMLYDLYSAKSFLIPKSSYAISVKTHIQYSSYTSPIKSSYGEMFSTMSHTTLYNLYSTTSFLIPKSSYAISLKTHIQYSSYTSPIKSSYGEMFSTMSNTMLYNLYSTKSFLIPKSSYAISVKTHNQYSLYTSSMKSSYGKMFSTMSHTTLYNLYSTKLPKSSYAISLKTHIQYSSYTSPIKSSYGEMFSTMSNTMLYNLYSTKSFLIPKSSYAISVKTHHQYSLYTSSMKSSYGEMFSTMSHTMLYNLYSTKSFLMPKSSYATSVKTNIQYSSYTSPIKSSGEMFPTISHTMLYNLYSTKSILIPKSNYATSVKTHIQYSSYTSPIKSSYREMFSTISHTKLYNLYSTKSLFSALTVLPSTLRTIVIFFDVSSSIVHNETRSLHSNSLFFNYSTKIHTYHLLNSIQKSMLRTSYNILKSESSFSSEMVTSNTVSLHNSSSIIPNTMPSSLSTFSSIMETIAPVSASFQHQVSSASSVYSQPFNLKTIQLASSYVAEIDTYLPTPLLELSIPLLELSTPLLDTFSDAPIRLKYLSITNIHLQTVTLESMYPKNTSILNSSTIFSQLIEHYSSFETNQTTSNKHSTLFGKQLATSIVNSMTTLRSQSLLTLWQGKPASMLNLSDPTSVNTIPQNISPLIRNNTMIIVTSPSSKHKNMLTMFHSIVTTKTSYLKTVDTLSTSVYFKTYIMSDLNIAIRKYVDTVSGPISSRSVNLKYNVPVVAMTSLDKKVGLLTPFTQFTQNTLFSYIGTLLSYVSSTQLQTFGLVYGVIKSTLSTSFHRQVVTHSTENAMDSYNIGITCTSPTKIPNTSVFDYYHVSTIAPTTVYFTLHGFREILITAESNIESSMFTVSMERSEGMYEIDLSSTSYIMTGQLHSLLVNTSGKRYHFSNIVSATLRTLKNESGGRSTTGSVISISIKTTIPLLTSTSFSSYILHHASNTVTSMYATLTGVQSGRTLTSVVESYTVNNGITSKMFTFGQYSEYSIEFLQSSSVMHIFLSRTSSSESISSINKKNTLFFSRIEYVTIPPIAEFSSPSLLSMLVSFANSETIPFVESFTSATNTEMYLSAPHFNTAALYLQTTDVIFQNNSNLVISAKTNIRSLLFSASQTSSFANTESTTFVRNNSGHLPIVVNPIGHVIAFTGRLLVFHVANDTFYDQDDGGTINLRLQCFTANNKELSLSDWWMFNVTAQTLYGIPLVSDFNSQPRQGSSFLLYAYDSAGNKAIDHFKVVILEAVKSVPFVIHLKLLFDYKKFILDKNTRVDLSKRVMQYYGDNTSSSFYLVSIKNGSTIFSWSNINLHITNMAKVISVILDENNIPRVDFVEYLLPQYVVVGISVTDNQIDSFINAKVTSLLWKHTVVSNKMQLYLTIPLIIVAVMILIVLMFLLYYWRKKKKKKENVCFVRDRPSLLPDEMELKQLRSERPIHVNQVSTSYVDNRELIDGFKISSVVSSLKSESSSDDDHQYEDIPTVSPPVYILPPPYCSMRYQNDSGYFN